MREPRDLEKGSKDHGGRCLRLDQSHGSQQGDILIAQGRQSESQIRQMGAIWTLIPNDRARQVVKILEKLRCLAGSKEAEPDT